MVEILIQEIMEMQDNITMLLKLKDSLVQLLNHYLIMDQVLNITIGQHMNNLMILHIHTQMEDQLKTGMVDTMDVLL